MGLPDVKDKELEKERMIGDTSFREGLAWFWPPGGKGCSRGYRPRPISLILWIIWISLLALRSL